MRVAHFVSGFPVLSETFVQDEIEAFANAGIENVVVSLRPRPETESGGGRTLEQLGILEVLYPGSGSRAAIQALLSTAPGLMGSGIRRPKEFTRLAWTAKRIAETTERLRLLGVDHCHAHFAHYPASMAWGVSKVLSIPYTFNAHSYDLFKYRAHSRRRIRDASLIFPISDWNREEIIRQGGLSESEAKKVHVSRCGIRLEDYPFGDLAQSASDALPHIVGVGRLVDTKGFHDLIRAFSLVVRRGWNGVLDVVGEGPERERLNRIAQNLGMESRIVFHGGLPRDSTRDIQLRASLVVQPCCGGQDGLDGIPVVLMEAMALGIPVISTRFQSIPELVEDGVTGRLVPAGDSEALAETIQIAFERPEETENMRRNARARVEAIYDGNRNYRMKADRIREWEKETLRM